MNTNTFGEPNAQLALQLICGWSAGIAGPAIAVLYDGWKHDGEITFDICDYLLGSRGARYCGHRAHREELERIALLDFPRISEHVWQIGGRNISPICLQTMTPDRYNYWYYADAFGLAEDFYDYPGKYWGGQVPLEAALSPDSKWPLSLLADLHECNRPLERERRKVELNYIEVAGDMYSPTSYRLLAQWGPRECGILVLHLRDKCSSLVFVIMNERDAEFGQDFNSYAHFSFEGKNFIAPVTNLLRLEEFLEILRQGQRTTHR